jgi:hypothetical protein
MCQSATMMMSTGARTNVPVPTARSFVPFVLNGACVRHRSPTNLNRRNFHIHIGNKKHQQSITLLIYFRSEKTLHRYLYTQP